MPVYEYRCARCRQKTSVFVRSFTVKEPPVCSRCGNAETTRVFSTFAVGRSSTPDLAAMADDLASFNPNDPQAMARALRESNADRGDDPELDEIVGRMEKGELPDDLHDALAGEGFHSYDTDGGGGDGSGGAEDKLP